MGLHHALIITEYMPYIKEKFKSAFLLIQMYFNQYTNTMQWKTKARSSNLCANHECRCHLTSSVDKVIVN